MLNKFFFFQNRKAIVVTARVHPGESNASWMMKGFIDYLLGNSADAKVNTSDPVTFHRTPENFTQ